MAIQLSLPLERQEVARRLPLNAQEEIRTGLALLIINHFKAERTTEGKNHVSK